MKNKGFNEKNEISEIVDFVISFAMKIKEAVINKYKILITKLRFSIILKLNVMYILRLFSVLFSLNMVVIGAYGYFTCNKIENRFQQCITELSKFEYSENNIPVEKLELISGLSGTQIKLYNDKKVLLYSSSDEKASSNTILKIDNSRSLENKESIDFGGKSFLQWFNNLFKFSYIFEKDLTQKGEELKVQLSYMLYSEFQTLGSFLLMIIIAEVLLVLLSIGKANRRNKKILKPIDDMIDTVRNITINHLDRRLSIGGSQNELKDLAETFNDMLDRIQQAYESQNQFVSDASHELRTPIAVIQGYAKLLQRWGTEDEQVLEESIEAIKGEAENMKELVDKLLFLARGDKNTQPVNMEEFYINELIEEVLRDTKLIDKEHKISSEINEKIMVYADPKLLKQALRIFVDNSIKYTPSGGVITLSALMENHEVLIIVKDNGIGIDEADLPNIFNRFYRADKSRTKQTGGTGLGLSIAKWIIMKHKGSISFESGVNKGTKVTIRLPIK